MRSKEEIQSEIIDCEADITTWKQDIKVRKGFILKRKERIQALLWTLGKE